MLMDESASLSCYNGTMIIAIIAGGSGTRLWPLSTPDKPKHIIDLVGETSLLQQTYARVSPLSDDIYVLTESSHADEVIEQLPDIPKERIIIEPARRNTASVIMLALSRIQERHQEDEPVVFVHADHHINDHEGFGLSLKTAALASQKHDKIALVGVDPHYPATGFGYIQKGEHLENGSELPVYHVDQFKEKPDFDTAQEYVQSGRYLWNMGLFAASPRVFEQEVKEYNPELHASYRKLVESDNETAVYLDFVNQPIDTALIEKTPNVVVVPGMFDWADIGSFHDLHKASSTDELGNYAQGNVHLLDVETSYIRSHEDKPVLAIGVENVVVINTPDGILVCNRDHSQDVGKLIKEYWKRNGE